MGGLVLLLLIVLRLFRSQNISVRLRHGGCGGIRTVGNTKQSGLSICDMTELALAETAIPLTGMTARTLRFGVPAGATSLVDTARDLDSRLVSGLRRLYFLRVCCKVWSRDNMVLGLYREFRRWCCGWVVARRNISERPPSSRAAEK